MEDNNLKYKHRLEHIYSIKDMHLKKLLLFYLQTSTYTYLGPYADFVRNLPDESADAWLKLRNNSMPAKIKLVDAGGYTGLKAAWLQLMNDFNSLMNNEKSFLFQPVYMYDCKNNHYYIRDFTDNELIELDNLATLMLDCDNNLEKLYKIYKENPKFKIMLGISTWN